MSSCSDGTYAYISNADPSAPWLSQVQAGTVIATVALPGAYDSLPSTVCDPADGLVFTTDGYRIYAVNTATMTVSTMFTINPSYQSYSMAWDAAHSALWVAENSQIEEYNSSGTLLNVIHGSGYWLAIDSHNQLWASAFLSPIVYVYSTNTLAQVQSIYLTGSYSYAPVFDGNFIWVTGGTYGSTYTIYQINPNSFNVPNTITLTDQLAGTVTLGTLGGGTLWVAETGNITAPPGNVLAYATASDSLLVSWSDTGEPFGITYVPGSGLYVTHLAANKVTWIY